MKSQLTTTLALQRVMLPEARNESHQAIRLHLRGLDLQFGQSRKPVLTLVPDEIYPHLYRIRYPNGWITTTAANLTRAKDAAYGHARYLLGEERPPQASYSPLGRVGMEALKDPYLVVADIDGQY